MSGMHSFRKTAAGLVLAVSAAGTASSQDVPAPAPAPTGLYGFSPVPVTTPVPEPQTAAAAAECQPSMEYGQRPATFWERFHYRRWEKKRCAQERWLGYPEEFCEQPLGTALYGQMNTQIANGVAAKLVLYQFDFVQGSDQLNLKGKERLARHLTSMSANFYPLLIEPTPDSPGLDESRRLNVQRTIGQLQTPVVADRVVVGAPIPAGLPGRHGLLLDANFMRDTRNGGTTNLAPGSFRAGGSIQGSGTSSNAGTFGGGSGASSAGSGYIP